MPLGAGRLVLVGRGVWFPLGRDRPLKRSATRDTPSGVARMALPLPLAPSLPAPRLDGPGVDIKPNREFVMFLARIGGRMTSIIVRRRRDVAGFGDQILTVGATVRFVALTAS